MPVHVPEHLEDLARRIRAAGAPTDFLESNIVEHVSRELGRKHAVEHAAALVDALNETPGAPRAKLWTKADRADVRVYFAGDLGYVTIGWDGSIGGAAAVPGRRSQSLTFSPDSLYPSQRRAYRQALNTYREGLIERLEEHAQERVEKIAELRVALGVDDEDVDDEALERAAERAAWQDAHEGGWGRQNPRQLDDFVRTFAAPGYIEDEPLDPDNDKNVPHPGRQWNEPLEMSAASAKAAHKLLNRAEHLLTSGYEIVRPVAGDSTLEFLMLALRALVHGEWSAAPPSMVLKHQRQTLAAVEDGSIEAGLFAALSPADMREYREWKARKREARARRAAR